MIVVGSLCKDTDGLFVILFDHNNDVWLFSTNPGHFLNESAPITYCKCYLINDVNGK